MAIMPQTAMFLVLEKHIPKPKTTSTMPLQKTKTLWFGKYLGMIRKYAFGIIKCIRPAKM